MDVQWGSKLGLRACLMSVNCLLWSSFSLCSASVLSFGQLFIKFQLYDKDHSNTGNKVTLTHSRDRLTLNTISN